MSDNPNADYYQPAQGTLAGFSNQAPATESPVLSKTGWSIDQLRKFLLNEGGNNFPTTEWMQELDHLISAHIDDHNNPHKVSLDQIIGNITRDILGNIVPGTTPSVPPFFAYDATCPLPLNTIFPASYTTTNLYRMTEGGAFIDPATEVEIVGVDCTTKAAGLPLFSSITNLVPVTWASDPSLALNTKLTKVVHDAGIYPFDFYRVDETNSTGEFGISVPVQETASQMYTFSVFVVPLYVDGSFIVRQPGNNDAIMTIDVNTGEFTVGANVTGDVIVYPSGMFKISYSFITPTTPTNRVQIVHQAPGDSSPTRVGKQGQILFLFALPCVARAAINYPILIDGSKPGKADPFVPKLNLLSAPSNMDYVMVSLSLFMHPHPAALPLVDTLVLQLGKLTLERDSQKVYLKVDGQSLMSADILPGLNIFTFSYSPTKIIFKDLAHSRQTVTGTYPSLATDNVKIGPCGGYLKQVVMYGEDDQHQCVEFLTNG